MIYRQIRFENTTFSFHIDDSETLIGLDFVDAIRLIKKDLKSELSKFNLPKKVVIFFMKNVGRINNLYPYGRNFCRWPLEEFKNFIGISYEKLLELELMITTKGELYYHMLHLFLHECAHFKFEGEEEADLLAVETLKKILNKNSVWRHNNH